MKQMEFTIVGQGYILGCQEGGEDLLKQAVALVDREMTAIRDGGKVKARERIAVLAALNLAYKLAEGISAEPLAAPAASQPTSVLSAEAVDGLVRKLDAALGSDGHLI